jgi:hypothetical protein
MEYEIYAPTYKRPKDIFTHKYFKNIKYVVSESEIEEYKKYSPDCNYWVCPDSAQGNLCRVRNWIMENSKTNKYLITDDDFSTMGMFIGEKKIKLSGMEAEEFIENAFQMAEDMGIKFWGVNCIGDPAAYKQYSPFSLKGYIGGPFQAHLNNDLRYDEKLPLKEDYDMTLQVLNKYRRLLRFNWYFYENKQHKNPGGCATYRSIDREIEQMKTLQKKWGSKIVKNDKNLWREMKKKKTIDINPIIRVPIKGI